MLGKTIQKSSFYLKDISSVSYFSCGGNTQGIENDFLFKHLFNHKVYKTLKTERDGETMLLR